MNRKPHRHKLVVQGIGLSYLEWGRLQPGRPSLVILHGLLAAAETFDRVVDGIDPTLHVLALDLPSNGHSDRCPLDHTSTAALAAYIRGFIEHMQLDRPILLGHSHGGLLAMRLAVNEPDSVAGLILLAPAHPYNGYRESMVRYYLQPFGRNAARLIFPRIPARLYLYFFRQMPGTRDHFDMEVLKPYLHSLRRGGAVPYTLAVLKSWHEDMERLASDLERAPLACPTLVFWGGKDQVVPATTAPALLEHMNDLTFIPLPQAGHLPNEEMPDEVARQIQQWFDANADTHQPIGVLIR